MSAEREGGRPRRQTQRRQTKRRQAKRRQRPRLDRARRGRLWGWLGLGLVGVVLTWLLRDRRPRRSPAAAPESEAEPIFELPPDAEVSWIPGAAGSLRIAERHRGGEIGILFVHGLGGRLEQWAPLVRVLGPAIHGVALDLPGHGGSDFAGDELGVSTLQAAIGAAAISAGLRRPLLVAHSGGATAALEYAAHHPGRVAGLLLVDPDGDVSRLPKKQRRGLAEALARDPRGEIEWQFRQVLSGSRPSVAERVMADLARVDADLLASAVTSALDHSPLPAFERYGGPVRALVSASNHTPHSLPRLRPEIAARTVAGAGHWLMMDRPDEVWAEIVSFLEELRRRGRL